MNALDVPELVQLLTPAGERVTSPEFDPWVADVDDAQLRELYRDMVVVRRIDTEATALQRQGELALWPPLLGQEAAQVASARALRADDFVFTSYRENAVAYCRGAAPVELVSVWRAVTATGWNPYSINMATPQVVIGAQTLHATGYALGIQADEADSVAVAYFGDGATSEGDVSEALVFAAAYRAPVIFFCQNNHWAISEPVTLQTRGTLADRGIGFGIPAMRVDGNDVLAVTAATRIALDRARSGGGPTFIEAVTYRMGPHTTADDPTRYRPTAELDEWRQRDPIVRLEAHLMSRDALPDDFRTEVQNLAHTIAAELRAGCIALPDPDPLSIFDHVYAEPHPALERQRDWYSHYLDGFEGAS